MDDKTLHTLEFDKILDQLAAYAAFAASAERARAIRRTRDLDEARRWQSETREALQLQVTHSDLTIGGARDVRAAVDLAGRGGVLDPGDLLDVKFTLIAARNLLRTFERLAAQYPNLSAIVARMTIPPGIIEAITQ